MVLCMFIPRFSELPCSISKNKDIFHTTTHLGFTTTSRKGVRGVTNILQLLLCT
jgi:hypothetical protein